MVQDGGIARAFCRDLPIEDFTGKNLKLEFIIPDDPFGEPKYTEDRVPRARHDLRRSAHRQGATYLKETGEIQEKDIFMGDFPLMTEQGTFIINGAERVVVSQLVRSPGVYYTSEDDPATGRISSWPS